MNLPPPELRFFYLLNRIYFRLKESAYRVGKNFLSLNTSNWWHLRMIGDLIYQRQLAGHALLDSKNL
jgi:hypothetical protein